MKHRRGLTVVLVLALILLFSAVALADVYDSYTFHWNGHPDNTEDFYGYYYTLAAGALGNDLPPSPSYPVVQVGDDLSGGTYGYHQWVSAGTTGVDYVAGLALSMYDTVGSRVYDNNGLDTPGQQAVIDFYASGPPSQVISYSMANNWDWVTAGYFHLEESLEIKKIVGYFDEWGIYQYGSYFYPDFQQDSPYIRYRMNIYDSALRQIPSGDTTRLWPAVDSFYGDVFTTDTTAGSFAWSDTGYDRVDAGSISHNIYRIVFTLDSPITLEAGDYFYEHDAYVIPEPTTLILVGLGLSGLGLLKRRRRK